MNKEKFWENWSKQHRKGTLMSPGVECPLCKKRTRAKYECQWCKTKWSSEQLKIRNKHRAEIILNRLDDPSLELDNDTKEHIKSYAERLIRNA